MPFCASITVTTCSNGRHGPGGETTRAGRAPLIQALLLPQVEQGFQNWWIHLDHHLWICCLHTCLIPLDTQSHSWLPQCSAATGIMDTCTDTGQGIFPPLAAGRVIPCLIFYASLSPSKCKGKRDKNTKLKQSVGT